MEGGGLYLLGKSWGVHLAFSSEYSCFASEPPPPRAFLHKPPLFAALSQDPGSNSPDVPYQTQSHANKLWHT